MKWFIYIPEEGDWPIRYEGKSWKKARQIYLKWAGRKRLPAFSNIYGIDVDKQEFIFKTGRESM